MSLHTLQSSVEIAPFKSILFDIDICAIKCSCLDEVLILILIHNIVVEFEVKIEFKIFNPLLWLFGFVSL